VDLSPDNSKFVPPATDINRTLVEHSQFEASPPGTQWCSAWTRRQISHIAVEKRAASTARLLPQALAV